MPGGDAHLVHPELRRLVRVHVVDGGRHSNHQVVIERHREVVPGIGQEFRGQIRIDRMIEDPGVHPVQHPEIAGPRYPDHDAHRATTGAAG
jgi:hypothetical protein